MCSFARRGGREISHSQHIHTNTFLCVFSFRREREKGRGGRARGKAPALRKKTYIERLRGNKNGSTVAKFLISQTYNELLLMSDEAIRLAYVQPQKQIIPLGSNNSIAPIVFPAREVAIERTRCSMALFTAERAPQMSLLQQVNKCRFSELLSLKNTQACVRSRR